MNHRITTPGRGPGFREIVDPFDDRRGVRIGDVAPGRHVGDARAVGIEASDEGELPWTQRLDMTKAREDLGYEPEYDLEAGFRQYIDVLREEEGLEPI